MVKGVSAKGLISVCGAWKSPFSNKVGANVRKKLPSFQLWIKPRSLTSPFIQCLAQYFTVAIHVQHTTYMYGRPQFQQRNSSIPGAFTICVWNGRFCFPAINLSTGRGLKCIDKCNISTWLWALSWAAKFDGLAKNLQKIGSDLEKQISRLDNCFWRGWANFLKGHWVCGEPHVADRKTTLTFTFFSNWHKIPLYPSL